METLATRICGAFVGARPGAANGVHAQRSVSLWRRVASMSIVLGVLTATPAHSQERENRPSDQAGSELAVGIFHHGSNFHPLGGQLIFDLPRLPDGQVYDGSEEDGTIDVQLAYRTPPLRFALKPRLTAKAQINTAGRTNFFSLGAEWRQHVLRGRVYGQLGIGVTVHDGYRFTPDPFAPGLSRDEILRRYDIYRRRTSFGSQVLFNPNASIGVRLNPRWALEATWEHYSHRQLFSHQNPGIDNLGLVLVRTLAPRR
jgi:lipid A 3-O-deacylase